MPLQFGEIVKQRRRHALRFGLNRLDARFARARPRHNAAGFLAIGRQAHGHLHGILNGFAEPCALIPGVRAWREGRHHFHVVFRHKRADGQFAFD